MNHLLSTLQQTSTNCIQIFQSIANELMNHYILRVRDADYRIVECEFYYHSNDHPDPYVHGHERQKLSCGEWYFHGSGLDITLGNTSGYGGILIRGIAKVDGSRIPKAKDDDITGPLNVCTEIFKQIGNVISECPVNFGFIEDSRNILSPARIFSFPRIGLNAVLDPSRNYCDAGYRFLSFLNLRHKGADSIKKWLTETMPNPMSLTEYQQYYKGDKC